MGYLWQQSTTRVRQQGMSLLELMVATFIFALAAGGLFKVIGESSRHTELLEKHYFAEQVAHNRLVELHLAPAWPEPSVTKGKTKLAERTFRWRQEVSATEDSGIRRVTVSVEWVDEENDEEDKSNALASISAFMGENP